MSTSFKLFLAVVLSAFALIVAFNIGAAYGQTHGVKYEVQEEIAVRYFQYIGNPSNLEEQCTFEYVVYGDCDGIE